MLSIIVIGPGCPNCNRVEQHARLALDEFQASHPGVEAVIEHVTDPLEFINYGVMKTPGLVIDGKLVSSGRIPSPGHIVDWLVEAAGV